MNKLFDFRCIECGTLEELYIEPSVTEGKCPECGEVSIKVISGGHFSLDPISGDFAGATIKWARNREKQIQKERKANS